MTTSQRDGRPQSGFSLWMRNHPELNSRDGFASMDIDWIWHKFCFPFDLRGKRTVQAIFLIEEKSHGAEMGSVQRDSALLVHQMLHKHKNGSKLWCEKRREWVPTWYGGFFQLRYEGATLGCSWIELAKRRITETQLLQIMKFEIHPKTMSPWDFRRHHADRQMVLPMDSEVNHVPGN